MSMGDNNLAGNLLDDVNVAPQQPLLVSAPSVADISKPDLTPAVPPSTGTD